MRVVSFKAERTMRRIARVALLLFSVVLVMSAVSSRAGVADDLGRLRNQCLYYAAGHAPNDTNTTTIRNGLYAQSPFSMPGEVDLAASGFSLASLPAGVENGIITSNAAFGIAAEAAHQIRVMVGKSAAATTPEQIRRYGYGGMLSHYPVWDPQVGEFQAQAGVEISSIDTTLLMYGLLVSANYFEGSVRSDYEAARDAIRWRDWLDLKTRGHKNQFHMSYRAGTGFFAWWDWYTQEAMLLTIFASMSDPAIDPAVAWRSWRRQRQTYTSPGPDSKTFKCYTTWFGDPFTAVYGLGFLDFQRFPLDLDGRDWFAEGRTGYQANLEFFRKERGYSENLSAGFSICAPNGVMARPNGAREEPVRRTDATLYTLAGGLPYFGEVPASNTLARTMSELLNETSGFFDWHGWPAEAINATNSVHEVVCRRIVGQDIAFTGLAIDNYLSKRAQNLVLRDPAMRRTLNFLFPPQVLAGGGDSQKERKLACRGIPFVSLRLEQAGSPATQWLATTNIVVAEDGSCEFTVPGGWSTRSYRLVSNEPPGNALTGIKPSVAESSARTAKGLQAF